MQQIKNIIFDLGGIFLNIDFAKTEQSFVSLGITHFQTLYTQHHSSDLFELLETGKLSPEDFCEAFRKETNSNLTDEQITTAWNALLLDFPLERIQWLESISEKYN